MGDKGQKNKDKHSKQVNMAKNEADKKRHEVIIKSAKNFGK